MLQHNLARKQGLLLGEVSDVFVERAWIDSKPIKSSVDNDDRIHDDNENFCTDVSHNTSRIENS